MLSLRASRTPVQQRGRAAQLLRVSRRPAASRRKERVRTARSDHQSSRASAAVGASTSGAAGVRGPPARAAQRARRAVLRRSTAGQPYPRPAQPASGGPPARGPKGARRAVLRRFTAGHQERGGRAARARRCWAQPRPPPMAGPAAPWCGFSGLASRRLAHATCPLCRRATCGRSWSRHSRATVLASIRRAVMRRGDSPSCSSQSGQAALLSGPVFEAHRPETVRARDLRPRQHGGDVHVREAMGYPGV